MSMDARLKVADKPRASGSGVPVDVPLVTLAWRVLRVEHEKRREQQSLEEIAGARSRDALIRLADEVHRLGRLARSQSGRIEEPGNPSPLAALVGRMVKALDDLEVTTLTPEGEPFSSDLMNLFENVAQRPDPGTAEPRVVEVVVPAVAYKGSLVRMGKAVIGIPCAGG